MKKIKCFVSIIVSLVLIFTAVATSFGAEDPLTTTGSAQITMTDTEGNAVKEEYFYGYMLMSASVAEGIDGSIEKAAYKINPKYRDILAKVVNSLNSDEGYADGKPTDDQIIEYLSGLTVGDNAAKIRAFADGVYIEIYNANNPEGSKPEPEPYPADQESKDGVFGKVAQGYWLIVGKKNEDPDTHSNTLVMLDTAGNKEISVQVKPIDEPMVEKKVRDNDTSTPENEWKDKADYRVGDFVPFRLTAKPQDSKNEDKSYDDFKIYKLKFTDTLSNGLRYYGSDKASDTEPTKQLKVYAVKGEDKTLIKNTTDVGDAEGKKKGYTVAYQEDTRVLTIDFADLKSIVAAEGETPIKVDPTYSIVVEYYAELLPSAVTTNKETNTVQIEYSNDPLHEDETAPSPEDTVEVYTYGLIIDKKENVEGDVQKYLEGAEFKLYRINPQSGLEEEIPDKNIKKYYTLQNAPSDGNTLDTTGKTDNTEHKAVRFAFEGLDAGTYILRETKVPDGYNGIEDIKFKITSKRQDGTEDVIGVEGQPTEDSEGTAVFDPGTGGDGTNKFYLYTTIINNTGVELPSTGGEGRKALLLFGVIFAVGAGVVLATNKRMKKIYR